MDSGAACRTCMKKSVASVNLHEPFKLEEDCDLPLADVLSECLSMQVSCEDGLPQQLCQDCAKLLQLLYTFRKQALQTEQNYKKIIENRLEEKIKEEQLIELDFKNENIFFDSYEEYDSVAEPKQEICEKGYDSDKTFACTVCQKEFKKEKKLVKHLETHENTFLCSFCGRSFKNNASLQKHLVKRCKKYNKCHVCSEVFSSEPLLLEHMKIHSNVEIKLENEERFPCLFCEKEFRSNRSLAMHQRKHKNQDKHGVYKCDYCTREFGNKTSLRRHLELHAPVKKYFCPKCPKVYTRADQLQGHMKTHSDARQYACSTCGKAFSQSCSLKDHMRIHTGETPYLCSECGKGFHNSSNLRQHMMRHSGLKPFTCKLCPKTFCTKGQMTNHLATHTGAHPYKCEECGAAFTKPTSLKKHKMIHTGVRPFACDTCNMRFTCKDHLKRHCRIHTGEKPYKCAHCERAFTQSNDLVKHTRQHVGQNIYSCTVCSMRFRLKSELKQHYPIHYVDGNQLPAVPIGKDVFAPVLMLRPDDAEKKDTIDPSITITISRNGLDKNGLAGDITININPE